MTSIELEEATARLFCFVKNIIVPNIHEGLGLHECDLLIVRKTGYALEVDAAAEYAPAHAGIIVVKHNAYYGRLRAQIIRPATPNKNARPLNRTETKHYPNENRS